MIFFSVKKLLSQPRHYWRKFLNFLPILAVCFALLLTNIAQAAGAPPTIISYQGRLADSDGNLLGGTGTNYYFKISFWNNATVGSGSQVWPLTAPTAFTSTVRHGLFNLNIGDTANGYPDALSYDFSNNPNIYLQVEVSTNGVTYETMSPRQSITSAAFAQLAGAVQGNGASTMGSLQVNGNSTTTGISYLGTGAGLAGQYINTWADLAAYLPATSTWSSTSDAISFNSLLDGKDKSYFFSTSSADFWGLSKDYLTAATASSTYSTYAYNSSTFLTIANAANLSTYAYNSSTFLTIANAAGFSTYAYNSSTFLTISNASSTYQPLGNYLTTSTNLTVANFASSSILQWTNTAGYLTSFNETDPLFMAASTSLAYLKVETDPLFMAASSSLSYLKVETDPIFMAASTSLAYLKVETDPIWTATSSNYLTVINASTTYLKITAASTTLWDSAYNSIAVNSSNWTSAFSIINASSTKWDTVYGWGNHALAGYLTTSTGLTITNFATTSISQWTNNAG